MNSQRGRAMGWVATALIMAIVGLSGCKKDRVVTPGTASNKIRVGYIGITCEAPIFVAVEKGFFKEEGLEVELVRCKWSEYKDVLALGGFDVTHHLVMYFLKPIEMGMDVKFTGGIHRGCLRVQAPPNGKVHTVEDLRGKRIGVPGMGTPPFVFASRVMGAHGVDATKDVEWKVFPAGDLGLAVQRGLVDAVATSEPIGSLLVAEGIVKNVADQATDPPYRDEYCCEVIVNGKFLEKNPKAAAAATRALLKAAKWVDTNPVTAARLSVEKKYISSNVDLNAVALSHLHYLPSVSGAEAAVNSAAAEMQKAGMLNPRTDVAELSKRAFVHLDGVSDEWISNLKVEKVAGGQVAPGTDIRQFAKAILTDTRKSCCISSVVAPEVKR
jgi:NitT/TauT family transport system substrate-binding protein